MGIEDIRLKLDVLEHPKIRELEQIFDEIEPRLGAVAFCSWLRLVIHAARNCQDGHLKMTSRRLGSTARWTGSGDQFAGVLIEVGLLEKTNDGFLLHDWDEHQSYVAATAQRVAKAKKAAAETGGLKHAPNPADSRCGTETQEGDVLSESELDTTQDPATAPAQSPWKSRNSSKTLWKASQWAVQEEYES